MKAILILFSKQPSRNDQHDGFLDNDLEDFDPFYFQTQASVFKPKNESIFLIFRELFGK
jgi:hypothetical protein